MCTKINETPNWLKNVEIINQETHSYVRLADESQARELMTFLEWLLPYDCESSKENTIRQALLVIEKYGEAYIHIFGLTFHDRLNRVTTLCTSVSHFADCNDGKYIVEWSQLHQPLYRTTDRDDSNLDEDVKALLLTLSNT
ncbi:hypothetical protein OTK49_02780 [Vibrio coralliirubri]|uniref:hypothetical protein n=1 Tax=Vibrio coralliirubri TaxID=1516159 RepID=UPI0022848F45|nr:hypothetical protein [Vibrio coralliirubri]MCY9861443.1 hypothetical protein [Vibrio coralliirubri]